MVKFYRVCGIGYSIVMGLLTLTSCQSSTPENSRPNSDRSTAQVSLKQKLTNVDVAEATTELGNIQEYIGTSEPNRTTLLRSQAAGRLLDLAVEVGDSVTEGRVIGRLDDSLLLATVEQEQAQLASLESELATEQLNVRNAQIRLQEAQIQLQQAQSDAERYKGLSEIGAISQQQAQSSETAAKVARQAVLLAQEEVNIAEAAVTTAMSLVARQKAAIAEASQRQAYTELIAPATGIVISKSQEPGNLVREGEEIVAIGDFSVIKIVVPISAVDLNSVRGGQIVKVQFDAFQEEIFQGKVSSISPIADASTRKIDLEITIDNPNRKIKSGLLARVKLPSINERVIVPRSAIVEEAGIDYIFVVTEEDRQQRQATVTKTEVAIDNSSQNQVAVSKGLKIGEKYVIRSSQPLNDREVVNLSILSE